MRLKRQNKRRLPLGIQAFSKIREGNLVYVDKTERIYQLATESDGVIFLARPRRFGKSLLCSTLAALFEGRRELFAGLAIDSSDWEWKKHPVIHIDLNPADYITGGSRALHNRLNTVLAMAEEKYAVPAAGNDISDRFFCLIKNLQRKANEKVAVIIDEYDKPLLDTINEKEIHETLKNELRGFYGVLKSGDEYLRFAFLTGVTKFSQVSVFSQLNNLSDISLNPDYCDICGISQTELEACFEPEIERIVEENGLYREEYIDKLRRFYNGYRFSSKDLTVYNPFGLLNHFKNHGNFETYWFATGTPTFLIKLMEAQRIDIPGIEKKKVAFSEFQRFDAGNRDALAVLYQSGYLTISDYGDGGVYTLDYPNEEVRAAFAESLLHHFLNGNDKSGSKVLIAQALTDGNIEEAMNALRSIFASIPYGIQLKDEKYYHTIVHLVFRMLGLFCLSEVQTAAGRIDSIVETRRYVYCFEFKLNGSADEALEQIDGREYLLPWSGSGKQLFKVGVSFDYEKRNIGEWLVKTV